MVTYDELTTGIISLLETKSGALGIKRIVEASESIDFNINAPFIYVHFDIDSLINHDVNSVNLEIELFVGVQGKSISNAKSKAITLTQNVIKELRLGGFEIFFNEVQFFAEFTNKLIVSVKGQSTIKFSVKS